MTPEEIAELERLHNAAGGLVARLLAERRERERYFTEYRERVKHNEAILLRDREQADQRVATVLTESREREAHMLHMNRQLGADWVYIEKLSNEGDDAAWRAKEAEAKLARVRALRDTWLTQPGREAFADTWADELDEALADPPRTSAPTTGETK